MKRLLYLVSFTVNLTLTTSAQTYNVKNVNENYVASSIKDFDLSIRIFRKIIRDKEGLYWLQSLSEIFSFDGVNWKSYELKSIIKRNFPIRINDMVETDDGYILLSTENGLYAFDPGSENFIPLKEKFPGIQGLRFAVGSISQEIPGYLAFNSAQNEGLYLMEWRTKKLEQIIIDSVRRASAAITSIAADASGNLWGLTTDSTLGVWNYNLITKKILCSWKGELPRFADKRFSRVRGFVYSANDDAIWITHGTKGYIEKMYLQTGKSIFYSFSGDLLVQADTTARNRYPVNFIVKKDRDNNFWVRVGVDYLVKLNEDISQMEYLINDENTFPIGDIGFFMPEAPMNNAKSKDNRILLWIFGKDKLYTVKRLNPGIRNIMFDTITAVGIQPKDYDNSNERLTVFFEKGRNNQYFLLQKNEDKPKLICFDNNLHVKTALFNNEWKQYPAFFRKSFDPDTFYVAIMRKGIEPLDFRSVVIKDFKVDLRTFTVEEAKPDFRHRVWHYGYSDADQVYWLFSNGFLYSYDPKRDILDSIFICKPAAKRAYPLELVKGFDYPTVLHKESATFWIDFIPTNELYKINLKTKKIEKIYKSCMDQKDCKIPGGFYDMYYFDANRIYLQLSLSAMLLNVRDDSLTDYSDLFKSKLAFQNPGGSGRYGDWICYVLPKHIYFVNSVSGKQKELIYNRDFKWVINQLNSKPLVNDRQEMILMSSAQKRFVIVNLDSILSPQPPGNVHFSYIKLNEKYLPLDSLFKVGSLRLKYNGYNSIHFKFSDYSLTDQDKIIYEYTLYNGGDTLWNKIEGVPELTFTKISSGNYKLLIRGGNEFGDYSSQITVFNLSVIPPFTQTVWFIVLIILIVSAILYGIYRYRLQQINKLQTVRNNIASDLHDDIGSTLNSISIYSEVAKQQAGKEIPALEMIGQNSRKIIESMSDIVWTINPENDPFEKIITRMRSFAYQLLKAKKVEYTFEVDEKLNLIALPMQVRKNFYLVFKEAITNVVKYSEASRVSIDLFEKNKIIMLRIRDNGKGIPVNAQTLGNGLMNMTRRAKEISAELNIISANGGGTEIELMLKT
jgi:two-component sensor histidine kinase